MAFQIAFSEGAFETGWGEGWLPWTGHRCGFVHENRV